MLARSALAALTLLGVLLLASWTAAPASALEIHKETPRGQVAVVTSAQVDGDRFGLVLSIERGVDRAPHSELWVVPDPDPANWTKIVLPNAPGVMAVGDVTGDGNDEVAITHALDGATCTYPGAQAPCGTVRVYDGRGLAQGNTTTLAKVEITPDSHDCAPTTYPPSALALTDVTGDGRAELVLGQLGTLPGSCGVVNVIPGERLDGTVHLEDACARVRGPPTEQGEHPNHFGASVALVPAGDDDRTFLAVGAPFTRVGNATTAGRLSMYELTQACPTHTLPGPAEPPLVAEHEGTKRGAILGARIVYAGGLLWSASDGPLRGFAPPDFEQAASYRLPRSFPLSVEPDITGDGQPELMAGPAVITTEGDLVLNLGLIGQQSFRGAMVSPDHLVAADDLGMRLWSLSDVWTPHVGLRAQPEQGRVGETLNVSISELITLAPSPGALEWTVSGGEVVEHGSSWIYARPEAPGHLLVTAKVGNGSAVLRVPVDPPGEINVVGPRTVHTGQPLEVHVHVPGNGTVRWDAPGADPAEGTGAIQTQYPRAGVYTIRATVTFSNASQSVVEHEVRVVEASLDVAAPEAVSQGEPVRLSVEDPDPELRYSWFFEGAAVGPASAQGDTVELPTAGWGVLDITVAAETSEGEPVGVGNVQVRVENQPPRIRGFDVDTSVEVEGLRAGATVQDPGGDSVHLAWFVDGEPAGEGLQLEAPEAGPGDVNVTVVATDDGGLSTRLTKFVNVQGWETVETNESVDTEVGDPLESNGAGEEDDTRESPGPDVLAIALLALAVAWGRRRP